METNPIRVCELLVGLPDVTVLGVVDDGGEPLRVHIETRGVRPPCRECRGVVWRKDSDEVELVDLPVFGRPARLVWHKRRWECPDGSCRVRSFTEHAPQVAPARGVMTNRAGRWVTYQVQRDQGLVAGATFTIDGFVEYGLDAKTFLITEHPYHAVSWATDPTSRHSTSVSYPRSTGTS